MSPKKKKPGAPIPKGCDLVSVSEVEAGVNSHVYKSGSGKSGSNLTEKDKVDFLCLLRQMSVSSDGIGNHTNSGMQSSTKPHASHNVTIAHTDITDWSQPSTATKPNVTSGNSPEWEYLNFQDLVNAGQKDQSANRRLMSQDIKNPWQEGLQNKVGENSMPKGSEQLMQQAFLKPQEMSWPAPPGLQQTKFVRQPLPQQPPQLPMPNFPQAQHPQLPVTQGLLPKAQSPFANISLPQHPLGVNLPQQGIPQHQLTQPQQMPHPLPVTPESPTVSSPLGIRPNSNQNPLAQSGLFLSHPGMAQPWPSTILPGQVQQNPGQHPLSITAKQPFLPVRPVMSSQAGAHPAVDIQYQIQQMHQQMSSQAGAHPAVDIQYQIQQLHQQMQQPFSPHKQIGPEQPWMIKAKQLKPFNEQLPNPQSYPQIRPPPGLQHPAQFPIDTKPKQENIQAHPHLPVETSAQISEEVHGLLENLTVRSGQQQNSPMGHQPNNALKSQGMRGRNNKQMPMNGANARTNGDGHFMDILRAALNYIDFRGGRPYCIPCQRWLHQDEITAHLSNPNHRDMIEVQEIRLTCHELPSSKQFYQVLSNFLEEKYNELRVTEAQMAEVNDVVMRLNSLLKGFIGSYPEEVRKKLEAASIRLYGSLATGMALKEDVKLNLDLNVMNVNKEISQSLFLDFVKVLENDSSVRDVNHVMADSFSAVTFTDLPTSLPVGLSLNNQNPYRLSQLLLAYAKLDQRVLKLGVLFRAWAKMCQVDNPDAGALLPHAFPLLLIHFLQKQRLIPVLHEMVDGKKYDPGVYLDAESASELWKTRDASLGELWVHLFFFYLYEHDVSRHVVCITQSYPYKRGETNWRARRIAIIEPFQPKRNVACHTSQVMSRYIDDCFLCTFLHFAIPQTEDGPAFGSIRTFPQWLCKDFGRIFNEYQKIGEKLMQMVTSTEFYGPPRPDAAKIRHNLRKQLAQIPMFQHLLTMQQKGDLKIFPDIVFDDNGLAGKKKKLFADWSVTTREANEIFSKLRTEKLAYRFEKEVFTNGLETPLWCRACSQVGHTRQNCPDEVMPIPEDFPPLSQHDIDVLNKLCEYVCDKWSASIDEITARDSMKTELLQFIREKFPDANLDIFGSSNNGFGSRQSDVDLCLTFGDKLDGEGIDFASMINRIADILQRHKDVSEVNPVSMAKVPIVKFTWKKNILVDLSLYNRLGKENTKLLKAYSDIDPRVRPLVYMMKRFVKTASIGDASRGSLSSYAYTLMVLYFLQQIEPPILPVLQELSEPDVTPPKMEVENANVYFYSDISNLENVWHRKKNEKTVGELWLDILDFYVSPKFHTSNKVVSIRKQDPLYKVSKMWMSANLCIEDPFDLSHNLGSGLSRRMSVHIVRCFQRARRHFGTPCPVDCSSAEEYFFDADKLSPCRPPCDRGCRVCGHIGHIKDECPERRRDNQEQLKPKKRQANSNQKQQGKGTQDNGRSPPTTNRRPEQPIERRAKPFGGSDERQTRRDRPEVKGTAEGVDRVKMESPAGNLTADKPPGKPGGAGKTLYYRREPRTKQEKQGGSDTKPVTTNPDELKSKASNAKGNPKMLDSEGGILPPPKIGKEKSRTYSRRKSLPDGGVGQKVVLPDGKTEPKAVAKDSGSATPETQAPRKKVPRKRKPQKTDGSDNAAPVAARATTD